MGEVAGNELLIGSFSAASNVTGILSDVISVTHLIKQAGGKIVWDYAGGGPYLDINMTPQAGAEIDAIALSPHKFIGGPGASGVLIVRRDAVLATIPANPDGGTVSFVNRSVQDYTDNLEEREEGGTPNIIGDIRAGLALIVKDAIGQDFINRVNAAHAKRAFSKWKDNPNIQLLGGEHADRLPIFSFIIRDAEGAPVDYQLFTRMLSDIYGIQARGGCACAGPYVHHLLSIDDDWSNRIRQQILSGDESDKPGFIRLNFSYLTTEAEADFILNAVSELAAKAGELSVNYPNSVHQTGFKPLSERKQRPFRLGNLFSLVR